METIYTLFVVLCIAGAPVEPQNCAPLTSEQFYQNQDYCWQNEAEGSASIEAAGRYTVHMSLCIPVIDMDPTGTSTDG